MVIRTVSNFAGWFWDQIPTHHQVEFWYRFPRTARWFERQANRRDERMP